MGMPSPIRQYSLPLPTLLKNAAAGAKFEYLDTSGNIDPERHAAIAKKLAIQERDAVKWHNACLLYFQTFSMRPFPTGVEKQRYILKELMSTDPLGN
jgi:hypothetical protein